MTEAHACTATCAMAPRTCPDGTRPERCPACDRWRWTPADLADHEHVHTKVCHLEPCTFRDWLCWGPGPACDERAIDWRERALKAEEAVRDLTRRLGEARPAVVPIKPMTMAEVHKCALEGAVEGVRLGLADTIERASAVRSELVGRLEKLEDQVMALVAKSEARL